ncbi:MAG: PrgI family protein [Candidatus Magasanikbacteria bacterium]|nr:PrgI family protein [Candidatus Magasanikbacteria bacterium]
MPQQFVVPQFIDVEDKIFGPVTTRQFLILLVTALILFIIFKLADIVLFGLLTLLLGGFSLVVAFVKVNGQAFHYFILNIFQTLKKPGLRVWKKDYSKEDLEYLRKFGMKEEIEEEQKKEITTHRKIRDLSLIVNTGGFYKGEE